VLASSASTALVTDAHLVALIVGDTSTAVAAVRVNQTGILVGNINRGRNIKGLGKGHEPTTWGGVLLQDTPAQKVEVTSRVNGQVTRKHELRVVIGQVRDIKVAQRVVGNLGSVDSIASQSSRRVHGGLSSARVHVRESQVPVVVGNVDIEVQKGVASNQVKTGSIADGSNQEGVEGLFQVTGRGRALGQGTTNGSKEKRNKVHLGSGSRKG